ncbi:MAG: hypothetical protein IK045_01795 [Bacteroidales bacterium]|nr:hypothetical protein [Bacteroidales bacterium]
MKNLKIFALIALALTFCLTGCKKDNKDQDNSKKLFNTHWQSGTTINGNDSNTEIICELYFYDDLTFYLVESHYKQTKVQLPPSDPDLNFYEKSGTFTLTGSKLILYVTKVVEDLPKGQLPESEEINPTAMGAIEGTYSDGNLSLTLYGQEFSFSKYIPKK